MAFLFGDILSSSERIVNFHLCVTLSRVTVSRVMNVAMTSEPGSVVGIATAYGLDGPVIGGGEIFRTCPDRP
jgi:hypothetical protein